ncbi:hypothetical protein EJB05_21241, partial [Eragrostis curvula]
MASSTTHGFHMNGGEGDTSYARNSTPQRRVQHKLAPLVEAAVADLWSDAANGVPTSIGVADLGCSSGPNTLFLVSVAVDAVRRWCADAGAGRCPEVRVYLNDLPDNDFNTVFRQLPAFQQQRGQLEAAVAGDVFVFGAPGSFVGRLFPAGSLHLVISSLSLHWLSQVPPELTTGELVNKGNICAGQTSSPSVNDAYSRQFSRDVTLFLSSRAVEMVAGGWVLIALMGRTANEPPNDVLNDMAARGLVDAAKLDSYNIPVYKPRAEEMREIVDAEGSFEVVGMESCETTAADFLGPNDDAAPPFKCDPAVLARTTRAVHEPTMARHFGAGIDMDEFVRTAEAHFDRLIRAGSYRGWLIHVLSLRRK